MDTENNNETSNEEQSFEELLEAYGGGTTDTLQVGDKIRGRIISIGREMIFVETGTKVDGVVEKAELLDPDGNLTAKEGDWVELYVVFSGPGEVRLSRALAGQGSIDLLMDAVRNGVPVEGKVKEPCKGGFHVEIMQRRAFCPASQIDLRFSDRPEDHVGKTYMFLVSRVEEGGKNIVVSRRELLKREMEKAKAEFMAKLQVGTELEGSVRTLMPYGAFVELSPGVEGMVHLSEMSWSRTEKPEEVLSAGERVRVKVTGLQKDKETGSPRIALSIKQLSEDPWETVAEKFKEGDRVSGTVTRCAKFGAFVEISSGIEGLVHVSEMSYKKRILKPEEVVNPGDKVQVVVREVDPLKRRISLSLKEVEGDPWAEVANRYPVGQTIQGMVEKRERFGLFVRIEEGVTGLFPASRLKEATDAASIERLKPGDPIRVTVESVQPQERKITLGPAVSSDEGDWKTFARGQKTQGTVLGEKLMEAMKKNRRE
jgi:small subunit ribosomal protein S1